MIVTLPERTRNVVVDAIARLIDMARGAGRIELLDVNGKLLAKMTLSKPCAPEAIAGTLKLYTISEDPAAQGTGQAVRGRIVDASGGEVFGCDVSGPKGSAVIKLNSDQIVAGGPVRISEFTLTMPEN